MNKITNYQLLKARKTSNDYFKAIANEVGLDYEHLHISFNEYNNFKIKNSDGIINEIQNLFHLTKETDSLFLFTSENTNLVHKLTFTYGGFELEISLNTNRLFETAEKYVNKDIIYLKTNEDIDLFLKSNNMNHDTIIRFTINKYGNYKNSTKQIVHKEELKDFKTLYDVLLYTLPILLELENKVKRHFDIVTSYALKGLNLPQDFLPPFMTISGMDADVLKGSRRNIMWYTSDEDGKGFDLNVHKSGSYLISPYIRDYISFDYYKKFNDELSNEHYTFNQKSDVESLMNDLLYFIENDTESINDESVLFFKELLENDIICNDFMLDCLYFVGEVDSHTQPSATFYEVLMENNHVMDSENIETFKDEYVIEYTSMYELIIGSLDILEETINSGDYSLQN